MVPEDWDLALVARVMPISTRSEVVSSGAIGPSKPSTLAAKSTLSTATNPSAYSLRSPRTTSGVSAWSATTSTVVLPTVTGEQIANPDDIWTYLLIAVIVLVALAIVTALVVARIRRRRNTVDVVADHADTPLVVRGLRKEYADGFVAVDNVDFTVQRGQVVGLLGPNGAGKTTSSSRADGA